MSFKPFVMLVFPPPPPPLGSGVACVCIRREQPLVAECAGWGGAWMGAGDGCEAELLCGQLPLIVQYSTGGALPRGRE